MIIEVTGEDISCGNKSGYSCPISLAFARVSNKKLYTLYTGTEEIWIFDEEVIGDIKVKDKIQLPKIARDFIKKFDNNEDVGPFSFELTTDKL